MKYNFAALRFADDKNLEGRLYWYLSERPLSEGEEVLAPVGPHDRLQRAVVERTAFSDAEHAPYDVRLIKSVAAPLGARLLRADGEFFEFGGVKYDDRHYTRFCRLLFAKTLPKEAPYGAKVFVSPSKDDREIYLAALSGCVLLVGGEGKEIFRRLYALVKGENALCGLGLGEDELAALKEKLG